jgi:hypothetical protein
MLAACSGKLIFSRPRWLTVTKLHELALGLLMVEIHIWLLQLWRHVYSVAWRHRLLQRAVISQSSRHQVSVRWWLNRKPSLGSGDPFLAMTSTKASPLATCD